MQIGSIGGSAAMGPSQAMRDRMFKKVDSDGDGSVSLEEFKAVGSNKRGGPDPLSGSSGTSVEEIFSSFDTDGDGSLSAEEFAAIAPPKGGHGDPYQTQSATSAASGSTQTIWA